MTYSEAKLCLSDKAKLVGVDASGELWKDGKKFWKLIPQDDMTWDCTRIEGNK